MSFVKIHQTILDSSIWLEEAPTRLLWITMLTMADADGVVSASIGGLAHRARIERDQCEQALHTLLSPDPDSRSKEFEGRRIEAVPGGWLILNHHLYRDIRTPDQIATAERVRRHRQRKRTGEDTVTCTLQGRGNAKSLSEAEAEADTEAASPQDQNTLPIGGVQRGPGPAGPLPPCNPPGPGRAKAAGRKPDRAKAEATELTWRVEQVWDAHLRQRDLFYAHSNGRKPPNRPTLTSDIRRAILDALHEHDRGLLSADKREEWLKRSKVRAAGIGLFFDEWLTGQKDGNRIGHDPDAKLYLDAWRPWKRQRGKPDPVERFSELYFEDMEGVRQ